MKGGTIQAFLSAMGCRIQIFFVELLGVSSGGPCFGGGLYVLYLLKSRLKMEHVNKQRRNFISGKFRKIWVESKWNTTIWVIPGIISGNNGTSD